MLKSLPAIFLPLVLFTLLFGCTPQQTQTTGLRSVIKKTGNDTNVSSPEKGQILKQYSALPLQFEQNIGQLPKAVRYMARGPGYKVLFKPDLTQISLVTEKNKTQLNMRFSGGHSAKLTGQNSLNSPVNYLKGKPSKWITDVPTFKKVHAASVYPDIDVVYQGKQGKLEYDIHVAPGGKVADIKIDFTGIEKLSINQKGDLLLQTKTGILRHQKPFIYQKQNGLQTVIEGHYVKLDKHSVGIQVGSYDAELPLIIDPIIDYATYLGGQEVDKGLSIAVDEAGQAYVMGVTQSFDFPMTTNAYQPDILGAKDLFIAKLSTDGQQLLYTTYIGDTLNNQKNDEDEDENEDKENKKQFDSGKTLALGSDGSVYVAGVTSSRNFPIINAIQSNYGGGKSDGFIFKLSAAGNDILFSSYWGGTKKDRINAITLDNYDNLYLTGATKSKDFPVLNGQQMKHQGNLDGFISKLTSDGQTLYYSSYLGGKKQDNAKAICVDSQQRAVITGSTRSRRSFPQHNSLQAKFGGDKRDAFVSRLATTGLTLDSEHLISAFR